MTQAPTPTPTPTPTPNPTPNPTPTPALPLTPSAEVAAALAGGRPVVALESTIITHGMPFPQNLDTARRVEAAVRAAGATPATIAVMDGRIRAGLDDAALDSLARARNVMKLSRADLAVALATGATGSTTVAATMISARAAGIEVFATGGIGGVHRGAETSFDVSADLQELAQTAVTVVAAGAKAILDLPKTLEVLETLGVPVIAFGQDELPAFWSRTSGLRAPLRLDDPAAIAASHRMRARLGLAGGQLVANPVPEADEIPAATLAPLIDQALAEAAAQGIVAKAVTPFLLDRIFRMTAGRSLAANIALVLNNARLAAAIAGALAAGPLAPAAPAA
jgi:pseudouridine-5'-phosphate glycosidase